MTNLAALPRIVVHTPEHVAAALAAARESRRALLLQSPPDCPRRAGIPWFLALTAAARADPLVTVLMDCADAPGLALAALREGAGAVRISMPSPALADMAAQMGKAVDTAAAPVVLDLRSEAEPSAACRRFLGLA